VRRYSHITLLLDVRAALMLWIVELRQSAIISKKLKEAHSRKLNVLESLWSTFEGPGVDHQNDHDAEEMTSTSTFRRV